MSGATATQETDLQVQRMYNQYIFPKRNAYGVQKVHEDITRILGALGISLEELKGKTLLDAGCGTGEVSCFLASCGARVTGIDFSRNSLDYAGRLAQSQGLNTIEFIEGSLLDYHVPEGQFDYVLSHMVLHHTSDPARAFSNIVRALKPGGSIIFRVFCFWGTMCPFQKSPLWKRWVVWLLAGPDPDRRVRIGERLFYRPGHEVQHGVDKATYLYDLFGVRIVYHHWWGELLHWLHHNRLAYHSSYPAMEFSKLVAPYLDRRTPGSTRRGRILGAVGTSLLRVIPLHRWRVCQRPSWLSRLLGQTFAFFSGANMTTIRAIKPPLGPVGRTEG
ncbi:MAG: class I SAM-dependent methyltransferase [Candidatus Rokubacteria bacterium]|nr:class I SAM-dependent methyltransferase [Candidatus Rokubacteria bacterium]